MRFLIAGLISLINVVTLIAGWGDPTGYWLDAPRAIVGVGLFVAPLLVALLAPNAGAVRRDDLPGQRVRVVGAMTVTLPLWYAVVAFLDQRSWWLRPEWRWVQWAGVLLFASGWGLMVWSVLLLGRQYSVFITCQPDHTLVRGGLYAVIRHPVYLGFLVWVLGFAFVFRSWGGMLFVVAAAAATISKLLREERFMRAQFSEGYADYQSRTWRLIPFIY